jgi:hypothetical protein
MIVFTSGRPGDGMTFDIAKALDAPEFQRFESLLAGLEPQVRYRLQAALTVAAMRRVRKIMVALRGSTELPNPGVIKPVNKPYYRRSRW